MNEDLIQSVSEVGFPLPWIDMVGLGLVALFLVLGLVRGLWWQVIRLLGVATAVGLARALSPRFTPTVAESFPELSASITYGLVWFALFVSGLVVASLLGLIGKRALEAMQLGLVDRAGGALVFPVDLGWKPQHVFLYYLLLIAALALAGVWRRARR